MIRLLTGALRLVVGLPLLALVLGFFAAFLGFPLLFWMGALSLGLASASLVLSKETVPLSRRAVRALGCLVLGPIIVAGILAPVRLVALGAVHGFKHVTTSGELGELLYIPFRPLPWVDPAVGVMGVIFTLYFAIRNRARILRYRAQIRNLPTSQAGSAALGLAEFKGVVRRVEEPGRGGVKIRIGPGVGAESGPEPEEARGCVLYDRIGTTEKHRFTKWSRFWLEDRSGRILVDPRGVDFWSGGFFLAIESQSLLLARRLRIAPHAGPGVTRIVSLREGDRVYVIGSAETDPEAPADAVGSERLLVRPTKLYPARGILSRVLPYLEPIPAEDYKNTFFVYDRDEGSAVRVLGKEERVLVRTALVWMALSLGLFWIGFYHPVAHAHSRVAQVPMQEPYGYVYIRVGGPWIMGTWPFSRVIAGKSTEFGQGLTNTPENQEAMAKFVNLMYPRLVIIESAGGKEQTFVSEIEKLGLRYAVVTKEQALAYSGREPTWGSPQWTFAVELDAKLGPEGSPPPRPFPPEFSRP
jgi:hypothetical protein